ncbi:hypothetical protein ACRQEO_00700 [Actinotignum sp. GS-2025b]|uniref:hypothetical protein n=1 Tax=Actinotignum sp. GS-2025b TaxID=3427275 RepID=UPI003F44A6C4
MKLNRVLAIIILIGIAIVIGTILYASQLYWPKVADEYPSTRSDLIALVFFGGFLLLPLLASALWATMPQTSTAKKALGAIGCMILGIVGFVIFRWGPEWMDTLRGYTDFPVFYRSVNTIPETAIALAPFLLVTLVTAILTLRKTRKTRRTPRGR